MYIKFHTYLVTVAEHKQGDTAASKEHLSWAKDEQFSSLKEDLQATQEKMTALREENKELQLKGKQNEAGDHKS